MHLPGADVALSQSPTPRQLAWLHEVYTQKLWCCCMSFATAWYFATVSSRNHSKIWHPKIQSFGSDLITGLEGKSKIFDRLGNPSFQLHALPQFCWWVSFCLRGSRQLQSPTQKKRTWWFQFFYCPSHLIGRISPNFSIAMSA